MPYGYNPAQFRKDYSAATDVANIFSNFVNNIPKLMEADEKYRMEKQKFEENKTANDQAFAELQEAAQKIGIDPEVIEPPRTGQSTDEYVSRGLATVMTSAQGKGITPVQLQEIFSEVPGAGARPEAQQVGQQAQQFQQQQAQAQQQQEGVNLRSELFGQPQPGPEQQAQQDIQQISGGQSTSFLDGLKGLPGAEIGGAAVQAPQGFSLTPPEQPQDMMNRLQVPAPTMTPDMPERRREAMEAGISGSELDMMLSEMRAGNMGTADFDEKIAKAISAKTKKKEAAQKAEAIRIKEAANRLRQAQKDFVIYDRETGQPAESIDYNRPDDYVVSQERRAPLATRHISEQRGGRGSTEAQSSKLLNNLIRQRMNVLKEMNKLRPKIDLDVRTLEAEGLNKSAVNKLYKQNEESLRALDEQINSLQGTVPTTEAKQDIKIPEAPKLEKDYDWWVEKLSGKKDPKSIDKFLRQKFGRGLYN